MKKYVWWGIVAVALGCLGVFLNSRGVVFDLNFFTKILVGVATFIAVVFPIVLVHEFGHFIVGLWVGAEPVEFSIGFGPKLTSFKYKDTVFKVCLYPLGGYVKFNRTQMEHEENHKEKKLHPLKWIPVILAGPVTNFIFAWVIFFGVAFAAVSLPKLATVTKSDMNKLPIEVGETVAYMNDQSRLAKFVRKNILSLPEENTLFIFNSQTFKTEAINGDIDQLAINDVVTTEFSTMSLVTRLEIANKVSNFIFGYIAKETANLFRKFNYEQVSGPIGISKATAEASEKGLVDLLMIIGSLSFSIGFVNLLPLIFLDGGRALYAVVQTLYRKDLPPTAVSLAYQISFVMFIGLFVLGTFSDLMKI